MKLWEDLNEIQRKWRKWAIAVRNMSLIAFLRAKMGAGSSCFNATLILYDFSTLHSEIYNSRLFLKALTFFFLISWATAESVLDLFVWCSNNYLAWTEKVLKIFLDHTYWSKWKNDNCRLRRNLCCFKKIHDKLVAIGLTVSNVPFLQL